MSVFSIGATADTGPKASADGAFQAPNRTERAKCWAARDAFFSCLDHHSIVDSIKEHSLAGERCGKEGQVFEKDCASSWVSGRRGPSFARRWLTMKQVQYFKKRRVMEHNKLQTLEKLKAEGVKPLPGGGGPGTLPPPRA